MTGPTRVLMLVENNAYPFDVRVRREACALRDGGYAVSVIAPKASGQRWREDVDGVMVYRFPAPPSGDGFIAYAIEYLYATLAIALLAIFVALTRGIDVIHAANPPDTLFFVAALFKPFGVRYVFDHHDLSPETYLSRFGRSDGNWMHRLLLWLEKGSFALADVVIATNESYRKNALQRGGKSPSQVFVVRNGPPRSLAAVAPDPVLRARAAVLVGYIGTMGPQDGVDYWLRALKVLTDKLGRRDILAVVIGNGDAMPTLRQLARELDIERYVHFTGRIPDAEVKSILSTVDVCVQPDPLGPLNDCSTMNKVMEYMAFGKPIVAFDLHETRFSAQDAAIYATPNDVEDFAVKVRSLIDNPEQRARMGAFGRQRVAAELAWEYSVPHLLRAYTEGLRASPGPTTSVRDA